MIIYVHWGCPKYLNYSRWVCMLHGLTKDYIYIIYIYEPDKGGWKSSSRSELTTEKAFFLIIKLISQEAWRVTQFRSPLFSSGEISFDYLPRRMRDLKNFKKWVKLWCRAGLLLIFTLRNYFTFCKIVLCIWKTKFFWSEKRSF